jgi:hypothetical protein
VADKNDRQTGVRAKLFMKFSDLAADGMRRLERFDDAAGTSQLTSQRRNRTRRAGASVNDGDSVRRSAMKPKTVFT